MSARLATELAVKALVRQAGASGGIATVLAKGDAQAGGLLIVGLERGQHQTLLERVLDASGSYRWTRVGPAGPDDEALAAYVSRRRQRDPDLWVVELDIAEQQRFVAGLLPD